MNSMMKKVYNQYLVCSNHANLFTLKVDLDISTSAGGGPLKKSKIVALSLEIKNPHCIPVELSKLTALFDVLKELLGCIPKSSEPKALTKAIISANSSGRFLSSTIFDVITPKVEVKLLVCMKSMREIISVSKPMSDLSESKLDSQLIESES